MREVQDEIVRGDRRLQYIIRLAEFPERSPTVVIFHGHQYNERPSGFRDPNWNVVVPMDRFGLENGGSWYLGEQGDFFVFDMIASLLERAREMTGPSSDLYFWGSSMGGYASIVYSLRYGAKACFASIPQTWLLGSDYANLQKMSRYFAFALAEPPNPSMNDLTILLKEHARAGGKMPLFVISANRFDKPNYLQQQIMRFVSALVELDINFYLEILPVAGHSLSRGTRESLSLMRQQAGP